MPTQKSQCSSAPPKNHFGSLPPAAIAQIQAEVALWPPLTAAQRDRLRVLLRPGGAR